MALFELPAHKLEMDDPAPSQQFQFEGKTLYRWMLTETERSHIASMLDVDASELTFTGSNFLEDRSECSGCGKQSGLDDFVHNALYAGIHSADFMRDFILSDAGKNVPFSEHELTCSRCVTKHEGTKSWLAYPPWVS